MNDKEKKEEGENLIKRIDDEKKDEEREKRFYNDNKFFFIPKEMIIYHPSFVNMSKESLLYSIILTNYTSMIS